MQGGLNNCDVLTSLSSCLVWHLNSIQSEDNKWLLTSEESVTPNKQTQVQTQNSRGIRVISIYVQEEFVEDRELNPGGTLKVRGISRLV